MSPDLNTSDSASILIVDDDLIAIRALGQALRGLGAIRFATRGEQALRLAIESPPDLILLDGEMPGMSGFEVCAALKADRALAHIPVIFVTSHSDQTFEESGFECGAADFIAKPIRPLIVMARARTQIALKRSTDQLRALSTTDGLTGLSNRRAFDEALDVQWRHTLRSGTPLSLLMIDVDHFKRFNDHYGHPAGDVCLHRVAQVLKGQLKRPSDVAARYGGEEFVLLLPATDRHGASVVAQRVLAAVQQLAIPHAASDCAPHVTVSIGVSSLDRDSPAWTVGMDITHTGPADTATSGDLVGAADEALYAAKRSGRTRAEWVPIDDAMQRRLVKLALP
jgi:diguanylate cyclase (GGDEF)-like protein